MLRVGFCQMHIGLTLGTNSLRVILVRIKNEYGDIISMKERPTGAEKLQTNFSFDLKSFPSLTTHTWKLW